MSLADKIEEIQKKPEHVRLGYVWFFVAISMVFVVTIWIFSVINSRHVSEAENNALDSDMINQFTDQAKTIKDIQDNLQGNTPAQSDALNPNNSSQNTGNEERQIPQ